MTKKIIVSDEMVKEARMQLDIIKVKLHQGGDYNALKKEAKVWFDVLNAKGKEIAKKYGKTFYNIDFTNYMR